MLTSSPSIDTLWSRLALPPISRQFQGCTSSISRSAQVQSYSNSYCMCCLGSDNQHLDKTWRSAWNMQKTSVKDIVMITPHLAQGAVHNKHVYSRPTRHISSQHRLHHLQHISKRWLASSHQYSKRCSIAQSSPPVLQRPSRLQRIPNSYCTASMSTLMRPSLSTSCDRRCAKPRAQKKV